MNPWAAIIGAVTGGVRASGEDARNKRQNRVEITREQWLPFTGRHGGDVQNADYMGRVMQGASTGMAMGQQMQGPQGGGPPTAGSAGMGQTQGAAFNGQGPTMAQQNGPVGSAIDYGSPAGAGYNSYPGAGAGSNPNPYVAPGMMLTDPKDESSPGASRKPKNVAKAGSMNYYALKR